MRRLLLAALAAAALLQVVACSRRQEPVAETSEEQNPTFWESSKHPLRINFLLPKELPMRVTDYPRNSPYSVDIGVDLTVNKMKEDPDTEPGFYTDVVGFEFTLYQEYFVRSFSDYDASLVKKTMVGNIPAIRYSHTDYVLLIPGLYVRVSSHWGGYECNTELTEAKKLSCYEDMDHLRQTLRGIRWTKPIDTSSKEFLDWKAHILALIEEARHPATTKSSLSP
ncbi:MAG: hypothetical protein AABZ44_03050 [Elusimicrobiota bacterium]